MTHLLLSDKFKKFNKYMHFSGSAALYHYQLGITSFIIENYLDYLDDCFITAASGGCLSAFFVNLAIINSKNISKHNNENKLNIDNIIIKYIRSSTKEICNKVNTHYTGVFFNYNYYFYNIFDDYYNKNFKKFNSEIVKQYNKNSGIFVTQKINNNFTLNINSFKTKIFEKWNNDSDVLECTKASAYFPIYYRYGLTFTYRNRRCLDGCTFETQHYIDDISKHFKKSIDMNMF